MNHPFLATAMLLLALSISGFAQHDKKAIEHAPLPADILNAKSVFLVNLGGSDPKIKDDEGSELVFDTIYTDFRGWGRYQLADAPEKSDITVEVSYAAENEHSKVYSTTNVYTGQSQVHSRRESDPTIHLDVYRTNGHVLLWSPSIVRDKAIRQKNRKKNASEAADELFDRFKGRVP
jgi:hypothetical protein